MMYCPTRVGVSSDCHASLGRTINGKMVIAICAQRVIMATLVSFLKRNEIPSKHSKIPKAGIKISSLIKSLTVISQR